MRGLLGIFPGTLEDSFKSTGKGHSLYIEWLISSYMLIYEYNIYVKALVYIDNLLSGSPKIWSDSYIIAYNTWRGRQIMILELTLESSLDRGKFVKIYYT